MDNMDIKIILLSFHKKTMNSQTLITFIFLLQSVSHNTENVENLKSSYKSGVKDLLCYFDIILS